MAFQKHLHAHADRPHKADPPPQKESLPMVHSSASRMPQGQEAQETWAACFPRGLAPGEKKKMDKEIRMGPRRWIRP